MSRPKAPSERLGNPRGDTNELEPAEFDRPELPEEIENLPGGAELWAEVWDFGGAQYRPQFRFLIGRYIEGLVQRAHLMEKLGGPTGDGWTVYREGYGPVPHPDARKISTLDQMLLATEKEIGLTPEAAARLGMAAKEASELEDFING